MQTNEFPRNDASENTTGCCPRFKPKGWDNQRLHFENKTFVRATTRSAMHIPWNMGRVFTRVQERIEDAGAADPETERRAPKRQERISARMAFAALSLIAGRKLTNILPQRFLALRGRNV